MSTLSTPPRPGPAIGSLRSETREDILRKAEVVFANLGFTGASLDVIAEAVGIRRPSVLHHFKSKREIYDVVERSIFDELAACVDIATQNGTSFDRLVALLDAWLDYMIERPTAVRIILRNTADLVSRRPDTVQFADPVIRHFEQIMDSGKASGEFKPVDDMMVLNILGGGILFYVCNTDQYGADRRYDVTDEARSSEFREILHTTARNLLTQR